MERIQRRKRNPRKNFSQNLRRISKQEAKMMMAGMDVGDVKNDEENGFPGGSAIGNSSTKSSSEGSGIHSDASCQSTEKRRRRRRSNNSTEDSAPFFFIAIFVFFVLINFSIFVSLLAGGGHQLRLTGRNVSQLEFDNSLIPLEFLHDPEKVGLAVRPPPTKKKKKKKLVNLASLPTREKPPVLNRFLDAVWSLITQTDEIRLKITDDCVTTLTEAWQRKRIPRVKLLTTSLVVMFIGVVLYQRTNAQTLFV